MQYFLTQEEIDRMKAALKTAVAIPFIDDIEDYILEDIWKYVKQIDGIDPFYNIRSKDLYDVVDTTQKIGWSVKSIQWQFYNNCEFELVIQRADVFKKSFQLVSTELTKDSDPNLIGKALLRHWSLKVLKDAQKQNIDSKRILILLKHADKSKFSLLEEDIKIYDESKIEWQWSNANKNGLKGIHIDTGRCIYRWYPSQKQLFERFILPESAPLFNIDIIRLTEEELVKTILTKISHK